MPHATTASTFPLRFKSRDSSSKNGTKKWKTMMANPSAIHPPWDRIAGGFVPRGGGDDGPEERNTFDVDHRRADVHADRIHTFVVRLA